mmetsp:Transcript_28071/g.63580  ORF Transcript_28071/g.63580 Transcript_28071/m.63580 type:complete len:624 (+) Transcript_28071:148-2019(+)
MADNAKVVELPTVTYEMVGGEESLDKEPESTASLANQVEALAARPSPSRQSSRKSRDIKWSGVNYAVGDKEILRSCWGEVPSGRVCAILGPSGAGKSSLLNVLAGRASSGAQYNVSGAVYVSGELIVPSEYRKNIAYVMQDDALMATATPREALLFSASMRLPQNTPQGELVALTEKLLGDLGLTECADVLIGNALIKGISGGQRKRTSVAVEIITEPSLLFLDEPTSGLDSHTASSLVVLLKDIAQRGSAVLCTIHQPSSEVFALFDRCIVMREGRIFYQGDVAAILPHFASLGCPCPTLYNPADFIMNLAQSTEGKAAERLFMPTPVTDDRVSSRHESAAVYVVQSSFIKQYSQLGYREFFNAARDPQSLVVRFFSTILLNLLYGLIFFNAGGKDNGVQKDFNAHVGAVSILMIFSMFGSAQPVMLQFPFERPMFLREYSTGTYSVVPYMLSKMTVEVPLLLIQMFVQFIMSYFLMDLRGPFINYVAIGFMLGMVSNSLALILGAGLSNVKAVTELANLVFVPQILFGGFFIRMSQVPIWLRWAQYLCGLAYGTKLAFITEFNSSLDSCNSSGQAKINCENLVNAQQQKEWWWWVLCMIGIFLVARSTAAWILVSKAKHFA